jgi:hypothetical protein
MVIIFLVFTASSRRCRLLPGRFRRSNREKVYMLGRCRERVHALAEKTIGVAVRPERLSILNRLRARLVRPAPRG